MGKYEELTRQLILNELDQYGEGNAFRRRTIRTLMEPTEYDVFSKHYGKFQSVTVETKKGEQVRIVRTYPKEYIEKMNRELEKKSKRGS